MRGSRDDIAAGKASVNVSLANFVTGILGAVFFAYYARVLSVEELGILGSATLAYTVFQYLGQFGFNRSAPSLISAAKVDGLRAANKIITGVIILSIVFSVAFIAPAFIFAAQLSQLTLKNVNQVQIFSLSAIIAGANAIAFDFDGITQGTLNFVALAYSNIVGQIVKIGISLILLLSGYRVVAILVGLIFGSTGLASIMVELPAILKTYEFVLPNLHDLRAIFNSSFPLHGVNLLYVLSMQIDLAILIASRPTTEVGIYTVVLTISTQIPTLLFQPIQGSLVAFMSKVFKETGTLERSFARGSRLVAFVCVPTLIAAAAMSRSIVLLLSGPKYYGAVLPLVVTVFGMIPGGFSVLVWAALQAHSRNGDILKSTAIGTAAETIAGILLIPHLGPLGAAATKAVLYSVSLVAAAYYLHAIFPLRIDTHVLSRLTIAACVYFIVPIVSLLWGHPLVTILTALLATEFFLLIVKGFHILTPQDVEVILGSAPVKLGRITRSSFISDLTDWLTT
jgi:O-antigen/teichoic acid export membrane protein